MLRFAASGPLVLNSALVNAEQLGESSMRRE